MFSGYKELFYGYLNFYIAGLNYESKDTQLISQTYDTAPMFKATSQDLCVTTLTNDQSGIAAAGGSGFEKAQQFIRMAGDDTNNHNQSRDPISLLTTAATISEPQSQDPLLNEPHLLVEADGSRVIRVGSFNALDTSDFVCIGIIFVIMLLAKRLLIRKLAEFKQIDQLGMRPKDRERVDEGLWRLIYYSFSSTWLIYTCVKHNAYLLLTNQPESEIRYDHQIYWSTYAIFMIETAFYLHATYALVFEDIWRRDSPMMLLHHLAAILAIMGLYATRTHQVGLISLVLRDSTDVLLEVVKLTKCVHIQHGKRVKSIGTIVNCILSLFTLIFVVNQLYYYPLYCLFHGINMAKLYNIHTPVMMGVMTCALLFLLLDFLWFGLILRLLYYMALAKPMKDLREYDDEDDDIIESEESEHELSQLSSGHKDKKD